MSKSNRPLGRKDEIVIQNVGGEVLIYDLRNDKAFCLNPTSAAIWNLCDGNKTVAEISGQVATHFNAKNADDLVWLALDQLKEEGLIDSGVDARYKHFGDLTRRQVIRKLGLGSMVTLPVIASLIAPPSALAAASCNCLNPTVCGTPAFSTCPSTVMCNVAGVCAP